MKGFKAGYKAEIEFVTFRKTKQYNCLVKNTTDILQCWNAITLIQVYSSGLCPKSFYL